MPVAGCEVCSVSPPLPRLVPCGSLPFLLASKFLKIICGIPPQWRAGRFLAPNKHLRGVAKRHPAPCCELSGAPRWRRLAARRA